MYKVVPIIIASAIICHASFLDSSLNSLAKDIQNQVTSAINSAVSMPRSEVKNNQALTETGLDAAIANSETKSKNQNSTSEIQSTISTTDGTIHLQEGESDYERSRKNTLKELDNEYKTLVKKVNEMNFSTDIVVLRNDTEEQINVKSINYLQKYNEEREKLNQAINEYLHWYDKCLDEGCEVTPNQESILSARKDAKHLHEKLKLPEKGILFARGSELILEQICDESKNAPKMNVYLPTSSYLDFDSLKISSETATCANIIFMSNMKMNDISKYFQYAKLHKKIDDLTLATAKFTIPSFKSLAEEKEWEIKNQHEIDESYTALLKKIQDKNLGVNGLITIDDTLESLDRKYMNAENIKDSYTEQLKQYYEKFFLIVKRAKLQGAKLKHNQQIYVNFSEKDVLEYDKFNSMYKEGVNINLQGFAGQICADLIDKDKKIRYLDIRGNVQYTENFQQIINHYPEETTFCAVYKTFFDIKNYKEYIKNAYENWNQLKSEYYKQQENEKITNMNAKKAEQDRIKKEKEYRQKKQSELKAKYF